MTHSPSRARPPGLVGRPAVVLTMLLVVFIFNFLDRQILGILAAPIKADLGLTDTQLGALGGLAFALLYSVCGVPLALLADRTSRSWVIAGSLVLWSGFTALCGMAGNFMQLFLFRLGVGLGEAGGVAPSQALISDYFPPRQRARAMAIYSLGLPLGSAAGLLLGGYIAQEIEWRVAFIVVGLAGVAVAPLFKWLVRDAPRPPAQPAAAAAETAPEAAPTVQADIAPGADLTRQPPPRRSVAREAFGLLARKPSFWLMVMATASSSLVGYGFAFWAPSVFMRTFGFDLMTTAQYLGSLVLIGGVAGVFLGGWLADRLGGRDKGVYAWLPAVAWLLTIPFYVGALLTESPVLAWILFLIPNGLNILYLGPVSTAIQHLIPRASRATALACFQLIVNLIGMGLGSLVIGALSDGFTAHFGDAALRYSAISALSFYLLAAILMLLAARSLRRDWIEETRPGKPQAPQQPPRPNDTRPGASLCPSSSPVTPPAMTPPPSPR